MESEEKCRFYVSADDGCICPALDDEYCPYDNMEACPNYGKRKNFQTEIIDGQEVRFVILG